MNKPAASPIHPLVLMQVESRLSEEQKQFKLLLENLQQKN